MLSGSDLSLYVQLGIADGSYSFDENGEFHWHPLLDGKVTESPLQQIGINGLRLPGLQMIAYANASNNDETLAANVRWTLYGTGNNYPSSAFSSVDESNTLTMNQSSYTDYLNTMVPKFISGTEELTEESFARFVERMNNLGVAENTQIRQEIYDRHTSR